VRCYAFGCQVAVQSISWKVSHLEMTCYVSSQTLNFTHLLSDLTPLTSVTDRRTNRRTKALHFTTHFTRMVLSARATLAA